MIASPQRVLLAFEVGMIVANSIGLWERGRASFEPLCFMLIRGKEIVQREEFRWPKLAITR